MIRFHFRYSRRNSAAVLNPTGTSLIRDSVSGLIWHELGLCNFQPLNISLLDKVGYTVMGGFQMDRHHLMLKELHLIYGYKEKVCLEQNISIGSHCME